MNDQTPAATAHGLAAFAEESGALAAVLLRREEQAFRPHSWWFDQSQRLDQARLLYPVLFAGPRQDDLSLHESSIPIEALTTGLVLEDPALPLRSAGLDEEAGLLLAEVAGATAIVIAPVGPLAERGIVVAAFENPPNLHSVLAAAQPLAESLAGSEDEPSALEALARACGADLVRLYRLDSPELASVADVWPTGSSALPGAGESLGTKGTGLASVSASEDMVLVETARRSDWLSALQAAQGLHSVLFAPLFRAARVVGVVEVAARRAGVLTPAIAEQIPVRAAGLLAHLGGATSQGELPSYELVRALMASPAFGQQEHIDRICLEVIEPDRQNVRFVVGGTGFLPGQDEVAPLQGSATQAVLEGDPAVVDTDRVNGWFNRALLAQGMHSVLRVPVRYQDQLLGTLSLASRRTDAFEDTPKEVSEFVDHLSLLVAAESRRGKLLEDERRAQVLGAVAGALAAAEIADAFKLVGDAVASALSTDALWFGGSDSWATWPRPLAGPDHDFNPQPRVAADLRMRAAEGFERSLCDQGYRSLVVVPAEGGSLVAAAERAFAFDAAAVGLLESTAGLLAGAQRREARRLEAAASSGFLRDSPDPLLTVEGVSGLVLDANDAARNLFDLRGDETSIWSLVPTFGQPALRDLLRVAQEHGQASADMPVLTRSGKRLTVELHGAPAGGGLLRLAARDVTEWRAHERLRGALENAALAAQVHRGAEGLQRAVTDALAAAGIHANFAEATNHEPAAGNHPDVRLMAGAAELSLGTSTLYIEVEATTEDEAPLRMLRLSLLAVEERLAAEEDLRRANASLSTAVAEHTRELEGLFSLSRGLAACESDAEAVALVASHASQALARPAAVEVCLDSAHVSETTSGAPAISRLSLLDPEEHANCRLQPTTHGGEEVDAGGPTDAIVPTRRGSGLKTVYFAEDDPARPSAVKLLLTHASQLGETLDRLATRREAEESRLRSVADVVSEGIAIVAADDSVEAENKAAEHLLADLPVASAGESLIPELAAEVRAAGASSERQIETTSGRKLLLTATPMDDGRIALTMRDTTDRLLVQERLAQAEKLAALGQLVSGVAHELNNPLTAILGFAQLLQDAKLDDSTRHGIQTIQSEAERAGKIIQDLLSFARRRPPSGEPVDINRLVSQVLDLRTYDLTAGEIELESSLAEDLPGVAGDPDQLLQVFFNVLTNAIQAAQAGKLPRRVRIETTLEPPHVAVRVGDSGSGVPTEALGRVFEPFFTTKPAGEGTGLGLSISYGIVADHGGTITIRNQDGGGAIVQITLPVAEEVEDVDTGSDEQEAEAEGRRRILVVDDEESIRDVLRQMLSAEGHIVEVAPSGAEALTKLSHRQFDLVVTDLKMPEISGQELYREIVASDPGMSERVIFITGDTVNDETRSFIESVENPTLEKPFRLEALRQAIERALS